MNPEIYHIKIEGDPNAATGFSINCSRCRGPVLMISWIDFLEAMAAPVVQNHIGYHQAMDVLHKTPIEQQECTIIIIYKYGSLEERERLRKETVI
jgi:hypothetical protein